MGVVNKKWYTVPDKDPYRFDIDKAIIKVLCFIAGVSLLFLMFGCSFKHKVAKTYEKAAGYSPITAKDSLNAIKIGKKVIKEKPPKLIPGKTIKVPVKSIVKVTDTNHIKHLSDSFENAMGKDANDIAQGCLDDVQSTQSKYYKKGFNDGYKKGLSEFPSDSIDITTPDITIPDEVDTELTECQLNLRETQRQVIALTAEKEIYRKQSNKWWLWLLGGLLGGAILGKFIKLSPTKLSK